MRAILSVLTAAFASFCNLATAMFALVIAWLRIRLAAGLWLAAALFFDLTLAINVSL